MTDMNEPLASAAGNAVEVRNAVDFLTGAHIDNRLWDVIADLGAELLVLAGVVPNVGQGRERIGDAFTSGAAAEKFGAQCIVVAIDAKLVGEKWVVHTHGGKQATDLDLFEWAQEVEERGAGEILFTSMDHDGTKEGFAIAALNQLCQMVNKLQD